MKVNVNNFKDNNIWKMNKGINEFKKAYQSLLYVIKKDYGTVVSDTTSISK